MVPYTYHAL
jgi:hypothetical protein